MAAMDQAPIAFLGIGLMGAPMVRNLLKAGRTLHVWNRSRGKAEALAPLGARVFDSAASAVAGASVVIIMLENGSVVETVLFGSGAADAIAPDAIVIDVVRRTPVALVASSSGYDVVDATGAVIRTVAASEGDLPIVRATGDGVGAAVTLHSRCLDGVAIKDVCRSPEAR